jgi:hypothetical protein
MAWLSRIVMNFYRKNNRKSSVLQESATNAIKRQFRRRHEASGPASATCSWRPSLANHKRVRSPDRCWRPGITIREIFPCAAKACRIQPFSHLPGFQACERCTYLQLGISMVAGGPVNKVLLGAAQIHLAIADSSKAAGLELSPTILTLQLSLVQKNTCLIFCLVAECAIF